MQELAERVAFVTGSASGIGAAVAERCAAEGMRVICADIDAIGLAATVKRIEARGGRALPCPMDVSIEDDWKRALDLTLDGFGGIDLLCNHAGVLKGGACWEQSGNDYAWVLGVNLMGPIHGARTFVPRLIEQGRGGHIVNGASVGGLTAELMLAPYTVAMKGVIGFSESLYHELALHGVPVGVSVLCPAAVDTALCDAERNRPSRLASSSAAEPSRADELFDRMRRRGLANGTPPARVAEAVLAAVRDERYWILPRGRWFRERLEAYHRSLMAGENPEPHERTLESLERELAGEAPG